MSEAWSHPHDEGYIHQFQPEPMVDVVKHLPHEVFLL